MKTLALLLCLLPMGAFAQNPAKNTDTRAEPYNTRLIARVFGHTGRWWGLMGEDDKSAFLDGYQEGMRVANKSQQDTCTVIRQQIANKTDTSMDQFSEIAFVCTRQNETADYDKVSVNEIDTFYSDVANELIPVELSMPYLRDKAAAKKTPGELLDVLLNLEKLFNSNLASPSRPPSSAK